jgi:hypothetical protein
MKVGKLYQVTTHFWMVFPSQELIHKALQFTSPVYLNEAEARATSQYYNSRLNWKVSYIRPTDVFVPLQQDEKYRKILTANGEIGWIWVCESDSFLVEEIKQ